MTNISLRQLLCLLLQILMLSIPTLFIQIKQFTSTAWNFSSLNFSSLCIVHSLAATFNSQLIYRRRNFLLEQNCDRQPDGSKNRSLLGKGARAAKAVL